MGVRQVNSAARGRYSVSKIITQSIDALVLPQRRSSFGASDAVHGASDLDLRIHNTLDLINTRIPEAIESVEKDIAVANRDKVILALANFLGSKAFL